MNYMRAEEGINIDIYHFRERGRQYCVTEGSEHYKGRGMEPAEYAIANGKFEDWATINIIKYVERFKDTRNPDDLKKVVEYAHILCGIELEKGGIA